MKKKTKRFVIVAAGKVWLVAMLVLLCALVPITASLASPEGQLNKHFFKEKADYQGIISLWNVDTFEGGFASKATFLERVAAKFEAKFKGALIKVENLSQDELKARVAAGQCPDLFSFGTGVGGLLLEKMACLGAPAGLLPNFYAAGLCGGNLLAYPFSYGAYAIISTSDRLASANAEPSRLAADFATLAYDKNSGKRTKHVYSLSLGVGQHTSALEALSRTKSDLSLAALVASGAVEAGYESRTPYQAYESFARGGSVCLLGSQRDVFRMENRVLSGKESDILIAPLGAYTDLVNFISVTTSDGAKMATCKQFASFLMEQKAQSMLSEMGLFSPMGLKLYQAGPMAEFEQSGGEGIQARNAF